MNPEQTSRLQAQLAGKHILLTGGLGMIGSTIAHKLVGLGANVTIVDACIEPYGANLFNLNGIRKQVELNIADIRDKAAMRILVQGKDYIFNLAGQVSHNDSLKDAFLDADINYIGHLNVIESVRQYNPRARVLYSGSRLQFGPIESNPVAEDHPLKPLTPYAFNKTVAENMYEFYSSVHHIETVMFRIANPYGIRSQMKHSKYSIVNFFIRQAMEEKEITIFGDGQQLRDYIYVEDLADAFILAAAQPGISGEKYNVGTGIGTAFRDMVQAVVDTVGKGIVRYIPWPENYLNVETGDYITDITKIRRDLAWEPEFALPEGIKTTYAYYQQHGSHYF